LVKLRLTRFGKRGRPCYRIVAMDERAPRESQALGQVGVYDPIHASLQIDEDKARLWLDRGAQMTDTVAALLRSRGILARWRGFAGTVDEDALRREKPKRRRKLASAGAAASPGPAEEAPAAAPAVP